MYKLKTRNETFEFEDEAEALANLAACAFYNIPTEFFHNDKPLSNKKIAKQMVYWLGFHHKRFLNFNAWFEKYSEKPVQKYQA